NVAQLFPRFDKVLPKQGHPPVQAWAPATRILRSLLPTDEGGLDKDQQRWMRMRFGLIPLDHFPVLLPRDKGTVTQMLIERFGTPSLTLLLEPQQPRDRILRGQFSEASRSLTNFRRDIKRKKDRLEGTPDVQASVQEAIRNIINAEGQLR